MKIIIFGTTGLIGNSIFNYLKIKDDLSILGSSRLKSIQDLKDENLFYFDYQKKENFDEINKIIKFFRERTINQV